MRFNIIYLRSILGRLLTIAFLLLLQNCSESISDYQDQRENMEVVPTDNTNEVAALLADFLSSDNNDEGLVMSQIDSESSYLNTQIMPFIPSAFTSTSPMPTSTLGLEFIDKEKESDQGNKVLGKRKPIGYKQIQNPKKKLKKEKEAEAEEKRELLEGVTNELSFEDLPDEVAEYIFSYVGFPDVLKCMQLNHHCNEVIKSRTQRSRRVDWECFRTIDFNNRVLWKLGGPYNPASGFAFRYLIKKVKELPQILWPYLIYTKVEEFHFNNLTLDDFPINFLSTILPYKRDLKSLELIAIKIPMKGIETLSCVLPHLDSLEHLALCSNRIGDKGAATLALGLNQLKKLKKLDLANVGLTANGIQALADVLPQLFDLEGLNLSHNQLGDGGMAALAITLKELKKLKKLDLRNISLTANGIQVLVDVLPQLLDLEDLCLSNNQLGDGGMATLAITLKELKKLKKLDLSNIGLTANGIQALANVLPQLLDLEDLTLSANQLEDREMAKLALALKELKKLKKLDLSNISLAANGMQALIDVLSELSNLESFRLDMHPQGDAGVDIQVYGLQKEIILNLKFLVMPNSTFHLSGAKDLMNILPNLATLRYAGGVNNIFNIEIASLFAIKLFTDNLHKASSLSRFEVAGGKLKNAEIAYLLAHGLQGASKLEKLAIKHNQIVLDGAIALAKILPSLTSLKILDINSTQLNDTQMIALAGGLQEVSGLEKLMMYNNQIGLKGVQALTKILPRLIRLKVLNIRDSQLNDTQMIALADGLQEASALENLIIDNNPIGLKGAEALAKILPRLIRLKVLNIRDSQLNDTQMIALIESLQEASSLEKLIMNHNQMDLKGVEALARVLPHFPSLRLLDFEYHNPSNEVVEMILDSLKGRNTRINWYAGDLSNEALILLKQNFPRINWFLD